ncbi:MAG: cytochrome c [Pseudomonadota bacterium]
MPNVRLICLAGIPVLIQGVAVLADDPNPDRGLDLAQRWCSSCHVIGPSFDGGDIGPSFESVASRPGHTANDLRNWLAMPHDPMPDFQLTADQYEDLIAHIMSLRE